MERIIDPALVLYLPLHQLDGSTIMSREAYGHSFTATGVLWKLQGRDFDGIDDLMQCADAPCLDITASLTLEAWLKTDMNTTTDVGGLIYKDEPYSERGYYLQYNRGYAQFRVWKTNSSGTYLLDDTIPLNDNIYHHVVGTYHGISDGNSIMKLFVDAREVKSSGTAVYPIQLNNKPVIIGAQKVGTSHLRGTIAETRIYRRALTYQEIWHNYLSTRWRYT